MQLEKKNKKKKTKKNNVWLGLKYWRKKSSLWDQCGIIPKTNLDINSLALYSYVIDEDIWTEFRIVKIIQNLLSRLVQGGIPL